MFGLFSLISLLVIPGINGEEWKVQYSSMSKCVLKGSSTVLSGTYTHPNHLTVTQIFWAVNPVKSEAINLLDRPDYRDRVQYFQKNQTSLLKLSNVRREDEGMYCLRILTNEEKERFLGYPGIELKVTELRVEIPEEVVEKQSPVLVCKTTCNLSNKATFLWYKNGKPLSEWSGRNELLLESVSSDDTGNYSCAARDQEHLSSPAVTLSVRYPPKSVSVSVSPSVIVEGDSVTLSCSSDSNPPAVNFSWFKEDQTSAVGSGQSFSISSFNSSFSGRFYCEAQNKYGSQRSASVSLSVKSAGGQNAGLYAAAGVGAALICICIIAVVVKILRKARDTGAQGGVSKEENSSAAGTNQMSTFDPGFQNDLIYASITHKRPKKHQSAGDDGEVQYATVHHHRNTQAEGRPGDGIVPAESAGSEDPNVIYSTVKVA
ncbi:pregnancy-specific beta-1-glycoprotein 5 isoform X2 [Pseudorasbora parva]|uniref:pregnancy-specific beta-1-glycoprotein 5 isoform X2 n=1 Tax=Pseudorasbora parva TaxID=51549 RepID=UPI00351F418A